jgi:hypothetical protein
VDLKSDLSGTWQKANLTFSKQKWRVMKGLKHRQVRLMAFLHRVTNVGDIFVTKLDELD